MQRAASGRPFADRACAAIFHFSSNEEALIAHMTHQLGWGGDHVGKLVKLQNAVRILAEGFKKPADRLEQATLCLLTLQPQDFPEPLRKRAARVLSLRGNAVVKHAGTCPYFRFADVSRTERKRFVADLIALYEACLIDIGRGWPQWSLTYPKAD